MLEASEIGPLTSNGKNSSPCSPATEGKTFTLSAAPLAMWMMCSCMSFIILTYLARLAKSLVTLSLALEGKPG